jgi:hypothetical protein
MLSIAAAFAAGMTMSRSSNTAAVASIGDANSPTDPHLLLELIGQPVAVELRGDQIVGGGGTLREARGKLMAVHDGWITIETNGHWDKDYPIMHLPLSAVAGVFSAQVAAKQ